jgi:putative heme-binding domain-containing protein
MGGRGLWVRALCAALWFTGVSAEIHGQQSDARLGARRYMEYCAGCHGTDGRGGAKGPSLTGAGAVNRSDEELFAILRDGARGGMPPFAQIGDANIRALVHFLRLLENNGSENAPTAPPGDARAGRALYFGKAQCSTCHMTQGQGGFMARSITHYARNRTAETIRSAIVNPDSPLIPSTRVVTVTARDGQTLTGVLRNEDAFSVDLQTEDGRYHLLSRSDVARIDLSDHSLMPRDYGTRLSPTELNDIVSFLMAADKDKPADQGDTQ